MEQRTIPPCIMTISPPFSLHFTLYLCSYNIFLIQYSSVLIPHSPFPHLALVPFILSFCVYYVICSSPLCFPDTFIVILRTLAPFSTFIVLQYIKTRCF